MITLCKLLQIATRMVIQHGWGPDDSPAVYYYSNAVCISLTKSYILDIGMVPSRLMCSHNLVWNTQVKGFNIWIRLVFGLRVELGEDDTQRWHIHGCSFSPKMGFEFYFHVTIRLSFLLTVHFTFNSSKIFKFPVVISSVCLVLSVCC